MVFKKVLGRVLALLILGSALVFGMSGVYHEGPWLASPLIGSVKISIGGKSVSANAEKIRAVIGRRDMAKLDYFTHLKTADLRGSSCPGEIAQWAALHPQVQVLYDVVLPNGELVDNTVQELDLEWLTHDDVPAMRDALSVLNEVRSLNFGEIGDRFGIQDMEQIRVLKPDAAFHFTTVIDGKVVDSEAESIDLHDINQKNMQAFAVTLSCMSRLKTVEFGSEETAAVPWECIKQLKSARPDVRFRYSFTLYGQKVDLDTEKLDFRGLPIRDNANALYSVLPCMNNCTYLDLDSTGIPESTLADLRRNYPQTKIVWRVWFGENYSVRTDVERILASKPTVGGMIRDASMLKYCTDVKYLDLGHNDDLADLSFAASMPKLEVLIIAMTGITDISPLRNCPNLEYLELNSTNVADLSPLENLTGLHHLNIAACPRIKDITPLYGLTELERLWIGRDTPVPEDQARRMKELVPACKVNTTADDPHGDAWRFTAYDPEGPKYYWVPRYELLREQLGYNYQEYSFYWLDPYCDKEVPDEYRGMFGKEVYGL